ncbi:hypothetical protein [Dactylosporangium sp. CA-233914]|uniref:hypothetical protein n=1 Tax=Dactylosporangium sp. CA-233914 TaxID=3239934 RepID=UPI003D8A22B0
MDDLRALLPADPGARRETVREAVTWLVNNLGDPRLVASRCAELGPAVAGLGVPPQRLEALAILLIDALRANPPAPPLRAEEEAALRDAGRLAARWAGAGTDDTAHEPAWWSAVVTAHDRRRADLAVLTLRTYLPYPCPPGMRAVVEVPRYPARHRTCWVANLPHVDRTIELHVPLHADDPIGADLVERTAPGDRVRLHLPVGLPALLDTRPLLLIADRDAHAPIRAILAALRSAHPATPERDLTVYWPSTIERDVYRLADLAPPGTIVIRDHFNQDGRDWSEHTAFVAGTAASTTDDATRVRQAGVPAERTVIAAIG